ncbi:hypothetical protein [Nostoc sp. 'Peltigera malacea cyanobiont' DB3992]|uniref:hypothetical protein n=1 Tax=Nostoc sp. 'Peltigera malacea cyanobiont' DB3992 TaxID=1206980 RepID=UPI000C044A8F|nr:hypothetical protein [Nostoc sp. 'Peltigera malacea cyanobiont' DB3992]PHM07097.1 hypothetical protein CK516_29195 [Nostoc sp. 'Peltigera malacea cyanobiont' DB3992]
MIKIKSLILALSLSPLLLSAWQLPNQAQLSPNKPSKGRAGSVSGNNSGASGVTIFSVPVTIKTGGTTKSGNITVTNSGGTIRFTVPPDIQNILNTSAQRYVVTLRTGGFTQQQFAALLGAVSPLIVNRTEAPVPGRVLVIVNIIQPLVPGGGSLLTGSGNSETFATIAAAIKYVRTAITTLPVKSSISVQIGGNTTVIPPTQAPTLNSSSIETVKKVVTFKKPNGEILNFEIVGPRDKVKNANIVLAFVLAAGVDPSAANTSIRLGLTGADPLLTTDLILSLNGLVTNQNAVNLTKLNQAINAYNTIVDKADSNSLKALNNSAEFTNIRGLLQNIRVPLG